MRVLAISPAFYPQLGGVEQVALELALRVREHGVLMDIAHVAAGLEPRTETVRGLTVHRVPLYGNRFVGWAPGLGALAHRYELLHVHDPQLLAITSNVRRSCGDIPAVLSTHGGFWHTQRKYVFKRMYEMTLLESAAQHYRRVLASSGADYDYYRRIVDRVELCTNGVDVKRFNEVEHIAPPDLNQWVFWGRLSDNKRVDLAIEYVAHARRLGFPVDLLICGEDVDLHLADLKSQVQRLGLGGAVQFEPYLDDRALHHALRDRRLYITASEYEGFGLSAVEALAAGLIVVARDRAPLNGFFVDGRSGCTLAFDHSEADLRKLKALLARPSHQVLAMEAAAREGAREYDWERVAPHFVRHYQEVLAQQLEDRPRPPKRRFAR
jgi:alpha-1,3-mannosyltransferase